MIEERDWKAAALNDAAAWLGRPMTRFDAVRVRDLATRQQIGWRGIAQAIGDAEGHEWAGNQLAGMDLEFAAKALLGETWD